MQGELAIAYAAVVVFIALFFLLYNFPVKACVSVTLLSALKPELYGSVNGSLRYCREKTANAHVQDSW